MHFKSLNYTSFLSHLHLSFALQILTNFLLIFPTSNFKNKKNKTTNHDPWKCILEIILLYLYKENYQI